MREVLRSRDVVGLDVIGLDVVGLDVMGGQEAVSREAGPRARRVFAASALIAFGAAMLTATGVASAQTCSSSRPKIVGGHAARLADWPGQAAFRLASATGGVANYFCGGTVIAERWVLTAAHCFHEFVDALEAPVRHSSGAIHSGRLEVVAGTEDLTRAATDKVFAIDEIVVHEDYLAAVRDAQQETDPATRTRALTAIASTVGNDIALAKLARPWRGPFARLSLEGRADPSHPPGTQLRIAGFGRTESNLAQGTHDLFRAADGRSELFAGSSRLLEAAIELVGEPSCKSRYGDATIGPGQLCAGLEQGGKDSCQADSGGPLVAMQSDGCPYQVGIVSWGAGCAAEKSYGVYTRISHHAAWIQSHTGPLRGVASAVAKGRSRGLTKDEIGEAVRQLGQTLAGSRGVSIGVKGGNRVRLGADVVFEVASDIAGRLIVLDIDAAGEVLLLFPNRFVTDPKVGQVAAGVRLAIPGAGYGFSVFRASEPVGEGRLVALVTPEGFDIERFAAAADRLGKGFKPVEEPTSYLMRLVRQIETTINPEATRSGGGAAAAQAVTADGWAWGTATYVIER